MKKRKWFLGRTNDRIERLEREVEHLKERLAVRGESLSALLTQTDGVPLSQVISEYLYGEEEGTNG